MYKKKYDYRFNRLYCLCTYLFSQSSEEKVQLVLSFDF